MKLFLPNLVFEESPAKVQISRVASLAFNSGQNSNSKRSLCCFILERNVRRFGTVHIKFNDQPLRTALLEAFSGKMMVENEWWKSQLALEIHDVLREKEARLPPFTSSSPQLKLRRFLVDWLAVISEKIKSSHGVLHLAVYYMDYFMDKFDIQEPQLHLVALSCLLLAAKFEENEEKIPTTTTLNGFVHNVFTVAEFHQMELLLLNFFCWNLDLPTPVNFMEYYLVHAISPQDYQSGRCIDDCSKPMAYTRKYVHYFLEIALQDHSFLKFPPSIITSAAVAASRLRLHLCPSWTPLLIKVTSYTWEQIAPCVSIMLRAHDADEKAMSEQKAANPKG